MYKAKQHIDEIRKRLDRLEKTLDLGRDVEFEEIILDVGEALNRKGTLSGFQMHVLVQFLCGENRLDIARRFGKQRHSITGAIRKIYAELRIGTERDLFAMALREMHKLLAESKGRT